MQSNSINQAILIHIYFPDLSHDDLSEFQELAKSAGAEIVEIVTGKKSMPAAKYFVGRGKAEEIQMLVEAKQIGLVIFNHTLTPAQERNLEKLLQCRVLDRTGLILDIFAQRARSFEGRLQVELAQLEYLAARLVRGWSHLERQRGGIGLRGPGETQLEVDRRLIRNKIKNIKKRLEKVRSGREQGRRARQRTEIPTISLVGYTNVGKSTLFNKLTGAEVYAADKLFATLDPILRRIELPEIGPVILVDTVGFIRHLPHSLIDAFKATLEETMAADLLMHIIDASDSERREKIKAVNDVLKQINAERIPQLLVYNKIDLTENKQATINYLANKPQSVRISATTDMGLDLVLQALKESLGGEIKEYKFTLKPTQGKLRAKLYKLGNVLSEQIDKNGNWHLIVRLKKRDFLALRC